jgi:hypothetical protein
MICFDKMEIRIKNEIKLKELIVVFVDFQKCWEFQDYFGILENNLLIFWDNVLKFKIMISNDEILMDRF